MSTNDDITRRDFAKMTAAVTVVASGVLGAGSRGAKAAAPAQAMRASDAIGAIARGDLTAEAYAGALLARADELKDLNACIQLNRDRLLEAARAIDVARRKGDKLGVSLGCRSSSRTTSTPRECRPLAGPRPSPAIAPNRTHRCSPRCSKRGRCCWRRRTCTSSPSALPAQMSPMAS